MKDVARRRGGRTRPQLPSSTEPLAPATGPAAAPPSTRSSDARTTAGSSRDRAGGRPRDAAREAEIVAAAVDLVDEEGLPGLTMDALAARAGASKATLYRRWPDRLALAVALLDLLDAQHGEVPDTGSTREDLAALVRARDEALQGPAGALLVGLAAEARRRPDLAEHLHRHTDAERARIRYVLTRGVDRGDLPDDVDLDLLAATVSAAGLERALCTAPPLSRREATHLAARLLGAARAA